MKQPAKPTSRSRRPLGTGVAAVALGVLAGGCGATAPPVADPAPPSTAPAIATPRAVPPAQGPRIHGSGYSFRVPTDWRDIGDVTSARGADTAAAAVKPVDGFTSNINVVIVDRSFTRDQVDEVTRRARTEVGGSSSKYLIARPTTVAGSIAGHLRGPHSYGTAEYWLEQYLIAHGSHTYVASFSFSPKVPVKTRGRQIASVLASWSWT